MSKITRIKRLLTKAGGVARSFAKRMKSRLLATVSRNAGDSLSGAEPSGDAVQRLQAIMEKRKLLEEQIDAASRRSLLPDGLSLCLLENYRDESRERARLLCELEHELAGILGRLKALCLAPPEPEPEPRKRRFSKPSDWFPHGSPDLAE
jgi:hypothetical protein